MKENFKVRRVNNLKNSFFEQTVNRIKNYRKSLVAVDHSYSVFHNSDETKIIDFFFTTLVRNNEHDIETSFFMSLINDVQKSRINDLHKIEGKYLNFKTADIDVIREHILGLSNQNQIHKFLNKSSLNINKEKNISNIDFLKGSIQPIEFLPLSYKNKEYVDNFNFLLKDESFKKIFFKMSLIEQDEICKELKNIKM